MSEQSDWQTRPLYKDDYNKDGSIKVKTSMDKIITRPSSEEYRKNYDDIDWTKKTEPPDEEKPPVGSLPAPDIFHQVTGK